MGTRQVARRADERVVVEDVEDSGDGNEHVVLGDDRLAFLPVTAAAVAVAVPVPVPAPAALAIAIVVAAAGLLVTVAPPGRRARVLVPALLVPALLVPALLVTTLPVVAPVVAPAPAVATLLVTGREVLCASLSQLRGRAGIRRRGPGLHGARLHGAGRHGAGLVRCLA